MLKPDHTPLRDGGNAMSLFRVHELQEAFWGTWISGVPCTKKGIRLDERLTHADGWPIKC